MSNNAFCENEIDGKWIMVDMILRFMTTSSTTTAETLKTVCFFPIESAFCFSVNVVEQIYKN